MHELKHICYCGVWGTSVFQLVASKIDGVQHRVRMSAECLGHPLSEVTAERRAMCLTKVQAPLRGMAAHLAAMWGCSTGSYKDDRLHPKAKPHQGCSQVCWPPGCGKAAVQWALTLSKLCGISTPVAGTSSSGMGVSWPTLHYACNVSWAGLLRSCSAPCQGSASS